MESKELTNAQNLALSYSLKGSWTNYPHPHVGKMFYPGTGQAETYSRYLDGYIANESEWKVKHDELKEEADQLRRWKMEATELLTKINAYAHKHLEIKLGQCAVDLVISMAKERDQLKARCDKMEKALKELCYLKKLKEEEGRTNEYMDKQPVAWENAFALAGYRNPEGKNQTK